MQDKNKDTKFRRRAKIIGLCFLLALGYYIIFQAFYNMMVFKTIWTYTEDNYAYYLTVNSIPILTLFLLNILLIFRFNIFHYEQRCTIGQKIAIDLILSFSLAALMDVCYLYILHGRYVDWAGTAFNNTFIFLGIEGACYVHNFKESLSKIEAAKRMSLQYKYEALKAEINPHFLFNSLNILYSLIAIDPPKAQQFTLSFSSLYRYVMEHHGKDAIPVKEELTMARTYIEVLSIRYYEQLHATFSGVEKVTNQWVVPFSMQLVIENAIKHNVISDQHPMTIQISIEDEGIYVKNPIRPRPDITNSGFGLQYLSDLNKSFGKHFESHDADGVFTVFIPFIPHNALS